MGENGKITLLRIEIGFGNGVKGWKLMNISKEHALNILQKAEKEIAQMPTISNPQNIQNQQEFECDECGQIIEADDDYCSSCGAAIEK